MKHCKKYFKIFVIDYCINDISINSLTFSIKKEFPLCSKAGRPHMADFVVHLKKFLFKLPPKHRTIEAQYNKD